MRRTSSLLIGLTVTALALTACGDDDASGDGTATGTEPPADEGTGTGTEPSADEGTVTVVAVSISSFDSDSYEASAGEVTIVYENDDSIPHTLVIDGIDTDEFKLVDDDEGSVELEAGDYTLFCDVPGHRSAGMEATLTVS